MIPEEESAAARPNYRRDLALRFAPLAIAVATLTVLVAIWPQWVLDYGRVFAWPIIVGVALLAFRREITNLFGERALQEAHFPGGRLVFGDRLDRPQPSLAAAPDVANLSLEDYELDHYVAEEDGDDGTEEDGELAPHEAELIGAQEGLRTLFAFAQMYSIQLDFLLHLRASPDGLSVQAAQRWFDEQIEARPQFETGVWNSISLIDWLLRNDFIHVQENGNYVLSEMGERVLWLIDQNFWYAPKIW